MKNHNIAWNTFANAPQGMGRKLAMGVQTGRLKEEWVNNQSYLANRPSPPLAPLFSDLVAWWDISDDSSLTKNAGQVVTVTDKKGGRVVTRPAVNYALLSTINSVQCLQANVGSSSSWLATSGTFTVPQATSITSFLVFYFNDDAGILRVCPVPIKAVSNLNNNPLSSSILYGLTPSSSNAIVNADGGVDISGSIPTPGLTNVNLIQKNTHNAGTGVYTNKLVNTSFSEYSAFPVSPPLDGTRLYYVGLCSTGAGGPGFKIGEHLIYNKILNASESLEVENYLRTKWGIVNV